MEIISALISSIIGGLLVAVINYLFTRKKTEAEIEKLRAETQKILAEAEKIRSDTKHAISEANYYDLTLVNETVVYDGRKDFHGYDITSQFSRYDIQQDVIVIQSEDADLELQTYKYNGKESTFIPKNERISGYRKFHISCELKVISASYEVSMFMMETPDESGHSVDDRVITVTETEWTNADFYLRALPNKNYIVNIFVERLSGDGSIQIRNLVLTERVN